MVMVQVVARRPVWAADTQPNVATCNGVKFGGRVRSGLSTGPGFLVEVNSLAIKKTNFHIIAFKLRRYEALDFTGRAVGGSLEGSKEITPSFLELVFSGVCPMRYLLYL